MQMSDFEILRSWNNAVDRAAQVEVLADLNAVCREEMRDKLLELGAEGVPEPKKKRRSPATRPAPPRKLDELRAMQLYREGLCDLDLSEALGVSKPVVCQWRKRMRLTPNPQQRGPRKKDRTGQDRTGGQRPLGRRRLWKSRSIWAWQGCCA